MENIGACGNHLDPSLFLPPYPLSQAVPVLGWGDNVRVALDMGCGVASFAAYLESFGTRVMSVAPKDEHDAQIQFALERGVSAMVGVMGTQRQPYPANVFDIVHCARCRVPWHADGESETSENTLCHTLERYLVSMF